jgi:hypothetical protein
MKTKNFSARRMFFSAVLLLTAIQSARSDTLTVTNLADSGPGTFRDRIATSASGDTIRFGVIGTITLNSQLTISHDLRVDGPGIPFLKVSGNYNSRVFNITAGSVGLNNMVISDGRVVGTNGAVGLNGENVSGGGIRVASGASLGMSVCIVSNNAVTGGQGGSQNQFGSSGSGGNALGGGIANFGKLTITPILLVGNFAKGGAGGAISDGQFPGVGGQGWGGGLYNEDSATLIQCTVSSNNATAGSGLGGSGSGSGGGIYTVANLGVFVSTIASNLATGSGFDSGGGIFSAGTTTVRDATIAGNSADFGGGLAGGADLGNTILGSNTAGSGADASGSISSSDYNLIYNTDGMTITGVTAHNITGQNPMLGFLRDNGGFDFGGYPTLTMALLSGSPAIDQGKSLNSDQRGAPKPFDFPSIANAAGGNAADIGSFELGIPVLAISKNSTNVALSWLASYGDFAPEAAPTLTSSWVALTNSIIRSNSKFILMDNASTGNRFYRLKSRN